MKKKVSVSWSGGKDSAFSLFHALKDEHLEVVSLHTSLHDKSRRVGMHGIPEQLIDAQAAAMRLPLQKIFIPANSTNASYEDAMLSFYRQQKKEGIAAVVFGDIFLEDLKAYREALLEKAGLSAIFPLWGKDTRQLMADFLKEGFKTTICAANGSLFDKSVAGKILNQQFLNTLPKGVDPCGEHGEFHSFVHEGPLFKSPVNFRNEGTVTKTYTLGSGSAENLTFWFSDLRLDS